MSLDKYTFEDIEDILDDEWYMKLESNNYIEEELDFWKENENWDVADDFYDDYKNATLYYSPEKVKWLVSPAFTEIYDKFLKLDTKETLKAIEFINESSDYHDDPSGHYKMSFTTEWIFQEVWRFVGLNRKDNVFEEKIQEYREQSYLTNNYETETYE